MRYVFVILAILVVVAIIGVIYHNYSLINIPNEKEKAISKCIELCLKVKNNMTLESQCLSDLYKDEWDIQDWVCDIAHWPREEIDNAIENQCSDYVNGEAKHFVELDQDCNLIRAI